MGHKAYFIFQYLASLERILSFAIELKNGLTGFYLRTFFMEMNEKQTVHIWEEQQGEACCSYCGRPCQADALEVGGKHFCCSGCVQAYPKLRVKDSALDHREDDLSGGCSEADHEGEFSYLEEESIRKKILDFDLPQMARVRFHIPSIHCTACIESLETLNRLDSGIIKSEVHFVRKTICIDFNPQKITLNRIANLLVSIGFKPTINLNSGAPLREQGNRNTKITELGVAGFCFGNVMLFSFPEYLGMGTAEPLLQKLFSYLSIGLSLATLLYSGRDYFVSAWKGLYQRRISIDTPIAIGLIVLFLRSVYDIMFQGEPGYLDSLTGLVFFLLVGKWFQSKTYENLSFDRDYRSYFPLAVYKKVCDEWKPSVVHALKQGDCIRIRNQEIIPTDSFLVDEYAYIDYSFVTGESNTVLVRSADLVYAGGRLVGQPAVMKVHKEISQSRLTSLWNRDLFDKPDGQYKKMMDKVSKWFSWSVLILAFGTALYWNFADPSQMWLIVTAVLIVACPCALALAAPFTYGSVLRFFGRYGFYLKNADVVEKMAFVDFVVFDKTGTITQADTDISWVGTLHENEYAMVKTLASSSTHPLSALIAKSITEPFSHGLTSYEEFPGKGIQGVIGATTIKMGSADFVGTNRQEHNLSTHVYVSIDDTVRGYFTVATSLRKGIKELISQLGTRVEALLSGDGEGDRDRMKSIFPPNTALCFNQTPHDKLHYISKLQNTGKKVMMLGDGLNDSGALKQSSVGIALTDEAGVFTPACDAILQGDKLFLLNRFLKLSNTALLILKMSLVISLLYNVVGLTFAVTGHLTPIVAAVLMPISSISVVVFTTLAVNISAKKTLL